MASSHNMYQPTKLSTSQLEVLNSITDALVQGHTGEEAAALKARIPKKCPDWQVAAIDGFISQPFSQIPGATDELLKVMGSAMSATVQSELATALTILGTTAGTFFLTGGAVRPFPKLSIKAREAALIAWHTSKWEARRKLAKGLVALTMFTLYTMCGPVMDAVGYPTLDRRLLSKPLEAPKYQYTFLSPPLSTDPNSLPTITTEVLIIGSGAGGGVVASQLSKSYKCLVVEKGIYAPTGLKSRGQMEAYNELYQNGGVVSGESGSIGFVAGSVFGGGTAINWSGCFRTQDFVRKEWVELGAEMYGTEGYEKSLDEVCARMGVSSEYIKHNDPNGKLLSACEKLGYEAEAIPQNTDGKEHSCGFCSFGCPYGEKQGTVETFMVDAAKAGTEFLTQAQVKRLLFSTPESKVPLITKENLASDFTPITARNKCIGAELTLEDGSQVIVLASKAVVVSGGSINSPAILLRSGLKNPNVGKNLHVHPVTFATGYFDEMINPWDGSIMTTCCNVAEKRDGTLHGAKIEICMSSPGQLAASHESWISSQDHKARMLEYNQSCTLTIIVRDRDSGSVILDAEGQPRITYDISPYDSISALKVLVNACEIILTAGAKRVSTTQPGVESYVAEEGHEGLNDPRWRSWITKVKAAGAKPGWINYGSAHQMGSCAMGSSAEKSVVDPKGRVWGTTGLYVADASVFPSAAGVNPMVSVMASAHSISQFILDDLEKE